METTAVFTEKTKQNKKTERINISIAKQMSKLEINSTVHHTHTSLTENRKINQIQNTPYGAISLS